MEVCVSTVSIIVGDDALVVPIFLTNWINGDYHNNVTPNNSTSKIPKPRRYLSERDAHFCETEIASLPYRCGGQVFRLPNRVVIAGLFLRRANGVRPYRFVAVGLSVFYIQFSSFKQGAGSAFLCDQNLSSCSPNSRWQNVSSYTVAPQGFRFVVKPLLLIHEKWVFCCRKNATIAEMLPN